MAAPTNTVTLTAANADETRALGQRLGTGLAVGDALALAGPLGAGKTTFVQGLAQGLGVASERHVGSPTFALVNQHPGRVLLAHADLYRVRDDSELDELGLDAALDEGALAVEWADRFPDVLPTDHLLIEFRPTAGDTRAITATARGPRSAALLRVIAG